MEARNGEHGYGFVTKWLHWLVVGLLVTQFVVGYSMDDGGGEIVGIDLLSVHVVLGSTILVLAILRVCWRITTPLPPWAEALSHVERRVAHYTERVLLASLLVIPATGLVVVRGGDDDLVSLHVAAHVAFFAALTVHLTLVFGHRARTGESLLRRMT